MKIRALILTFTLFAAFFHRTVAQDFNFGVKAGIHYNFSGNLTETTEAEVIVSDAISGAENREGFHGGVYARMAFSKFFIQPELLYSRYKNAYDNETVSMIVNKKLDIPVLLGFQLFPALYINAGPDFQYLMPPDFSVSTTDVNFDDFTTGAHLGFGVRVKSLSLDVRYERGLTPNEVEFIESSGRTFTYDGRPKRILFSLQLDL